MTQSGWGTPGEHGGRDDRIGILLWLLAEQSALRFQAEQRHHHDNGTVPTWATDMENRLTQQIGTMMATLQEALDGWKQYVTDLKAQIATAVQGLTDAQAAAQAAADALAQFQADETVKDASALAAQAQTDADAVQAALDAVKTPVEPPPVTEEPITPI